MIVIFLHIIIFWWQETYGSRISIRTITYLIGLNLNEKFINLNIKIMFKYVRNSSLTDD